MRVPSEHRSPSRLPVLVFGSLIIAGVANSVGACPTLGKDGHPAAEQADRDQVNERDRRQRQPQRRRAGMQREGRGSRDDIVAVLGLVMAARRIDSRAAFPKQKIKINQRNDLVLRPDRR
jgi:hypothetical protein